MKRSAIEGWCLSEETYNVSIGKITKVEPEILLQIKEKEKTTEHAKLIEELQEKLVVRRKRGDGNGKGKNKNKKQGAMKSNGPKDKNGYYLCGNCDKTHKGVCCKPIITQQPSKQRGDTPKNG